MVRKGIIWIFSLVLLFSALISISLASALIMDFIDPNTVNADYVNRTVDTMINITINRSVMGLDEAETGNLTELTITLPVNAHFTDAGNSTDTSESNTNLTSDADSTFGYNFTFYNNTNGQTVLVWTNITAGFMENITDARAVDDISNSSFFFNVSFLTAGLNTITINASWNGTTTFGNQTTYDFYIYFDFDGYVKNETGDLQNGTNVTMYRYDTQASGPPVETVISSNYTTSNGLFEFHHLNSSADSYKIKIIYYNESDMSQEIGDGVASKVSSLLPPFPSSMFYPPSIIAETDFSLNGTTFYLTTASTLNLTALNATGNMSEAGDNAINFGYLVIDQVLGFPVESNILGNNSGGKQVVVPSGRTYTVIMTRAPTQFSSELANCDGVTMDDAAEACPAPPKSNSTTGLGTLAAGTLYNVNINLSVSKAYVYGCVSVADGNNNTGELNVTNIIPRVMPWSGFVVQGIKSDDGTLNVSDAYEIEDDRQINNSNSTMDLSVDPCSGVGATAFYNISLLANTDYLLEFFAKNASNETSMPDNDDSTWYLGAFQNVSVGGSDIYQNVTLYRLAGVYNETSDNNLSNTSVTTVVILNSTGDAITTNLGHVVVKVKHDVFGTLSYIIDDVVNGTFRIPILNNSNWAKVYVFPDNSPPVERTLNLSNSTNSLIIRSTDIAAGGDKGLRTINSTGEFNTLNASSSNIELEFFSTRSGCDGTNPPDTCLLAAANATDFNPLKLLVAGKVHMRLKFTSTSTSLLFHNYDMLSAKQPPMMSILNSAATTSATNSQLWEFGSFAPADSYTNVTIAMPYSDTASDSTFVNESSAVTIKIPVLFEEDSNNQNNWVMSFNLTRGDTDANLTDALLDYNDTAFNPLLSDGGLSCSKADGTATCFVDTSLNLIYVTIPHFSGTTPSVAGSNPTATTTTTSSGSAAATTTETWSKTVVLTDEQFTEGVTKELGAKERIQFKISGTTHQVGVKEVTATTAKIEVASEAQEATLAVGDSRRFDVTADGFYDVRVTLDSIAGSKASLTVKSIYEEVTAETEAEEAGKEAEAIGEEAEEEVAKTNLTWWIIGAGILVIVVIVIIIITKKRR